MRVLPLTKMPILIVDRGEPVAGVERHHCKVQIGNESKTLVKFHSLMSMCPHAPQFGMNPDNESIMAKDRMIDKSEKALGFSTRFYMNDHRNQFAF